MRVVHILLRHIAICKILQLFLHLSNDPLRILILNAALHHDEPLLAQVAGGAVVTEALLLPDVHETAGIGAAAEQVGHDADSRIVRLWVPGPGAEAQNEFALPDRLFLNDTLHVTLCAFHNVRVEVHNLLPWHLGDVLAKQICNFLHASSAHNVDLNTRCLQHGLPSSIDRLGRQCRHALFGAKSINAVVLLGAHFLQAAMHGIAPLIIL